MPEMVIVLNKFSVEDLVVLIVGLLGVYLIVGWI